MLDDKVLKEIVAKSLPKPEETLDEAYVAQPKMYPQVTELLSQQTKDAHAKLYQKQVKDLSETSFKIDTVDRLEVDSHSSYSALKADEADLHNAVYFHELFFSNCFDPHSEIFMDTLAFMRLQRDFGTFEQWQADFLAAAQAAHNGWVVCGYSLFLKRFVNTFVNGSSGNVMAAVIPVVVVDVHEHAYYRDYLEDKKSYIVAMMRELNWDVIESRFKKVEAISEAMK